MSDTTTIVSLISTASVAVVTAVATPLLQGRVSGRNTRRDRLEERRVDAYTDAMNLINAAEAVVKHWTTPLPARDTRGKASLPEEADISARIRLLGTRRTAAAWNNFMRVWKFFSWEVIKDGPQSLDGEYYVDAEDPLVVAVWDAAAVTSNALRGDIAPAWLSAKREHKSTRRPLPRWVVRSSSDKDSTDQPHSDDI